MCHSTTLRGVLVLGRDWHAGDRRGQIGREAAVAPFGALEAGQIKTLVKQMGLAAGTSLTRQADREALVLVFVAHQLYQARALLPDKIERRAFSFSQVVHHAAAVASTAANRSGWTCPACRLSSAIFFASSAARWMSVTMPAAARDPPR